MSISSTEIVDWFLNKSKSASQSSTPPTLDPRDFRGVCTTSDLHEILSKYNNSKLMPSADDIKSPNDYWTFLEPLFSIPLTPNMIPSNFSLPDYVKEAKTVLSSRNMYPAYHWQWAMEDCLDLTSLSDQEAQTVRDAIMKQLPRDTAAHGKSSFPLISDELKKSLTALDDVNRSIANEYLAKLTKWISGGVQNVEQLIRKKNSEVMFLANYCESVLLKQIEKEQFLDSIEEIFYHGQDNNGFAMMVDDAEKIKCYFISSKSDLKSILSERDSTVGTSQIESVHFAYPFSANDDDLFRSMPHTGPFCHVCRRRKPQEEFAKCTNKIAAMESVLKTNCHRRFCNDCLNAYNWPKPPPSTAASAASAASVQTSTQWKCPICSKLCTCDRCVRNVFIRSLKNFVSCTKSAGTMSDHSSEPVIPFPYTCNPYEIWEIVTQDSQYASHLLMNETSTPGYDPTTSSSSLLLINQPVSRTTLRRQSSAPSTPPPPPMEESVKKRRSEDLKKK